MTPHYDTVDGDPCFAHLASVPDDIDDLVVMVHRDRAADVVRDAAERGIAACGCSRVLVASLQCPMTPSTCARCIASTSSRVRARSMFLEPVSWFHRVHRTARDMNASLQKAR